MSPIEIRTCSHPNSKKTVHKMSAHSPDLCYKMRLQDVKSFGDALWYSYEYEIESPQEHVIGHGMSMCRRLRGRWYVLNLHNSLRQSSTAASGLTK